MFAKNLEITLTSLSEKSDVSGVSPNEMADRFKTLRANRKLPYGRERRDQALTNGEIAAAILGLASNNPEWAGHVAIVLCNLRAVGRVDASFFGNSTLQKSIERILTDVTARKSVIGLTISGAESGTNSHGHATLSYGFSALGVKLSTSRKKPSHVCYRERSETLIQKCATRPCLRKHLLVKLFSGALRWKLRWQRHIRCRPQEMVRSMTRKKHDRRDTGGLACAPYPVPKHWYR